MPVSGMRILGLQRWKHRVVQGFHKTVHLELLVNVPGSSDYRPGVQTTTFSVAIEPRPIVRLTSEEDISEGGENVSLGNYVFEFYGDQVTLTQMRTANRIVLNKGLADEESLQILQVRPMIWNESNVGRRELAINGGRVMGWSIFVRAVNS